MLGNIRVIPPTDHMFFTAKRRCKITATAVSCAIQRSAATKSKESIRSRRNRETIELKATKMNAIKTCDHVRFETGVGSDGCMRFFGVGCLVNGRWWIGSVEGRNGRGRIEALS
jgi:hypothetical protein